MTNTESIPGKDYEIIGLVSGNMIQSKHIGKDIGQGLKTIVGGELKAYTEMMSESRSIATARMVESAESMGADAVVCVRFATSAIMGGAAEMVCYGTAVKFKRSPQEKRRRIGTSALGVVALFSVFLPAAVSRVRSAGVRDAGCRTACPVPPPARR